MKQDRFLIGILVFIGLLVVIALVLFFVRQEMPTYGPEDTPEGVVSNYAVALQRAEYERAYSYLADKENKPSLQYFQQAFITNQLDISNAGVQLGKPVTNGDQAWVSVTLVYASSGPFSGGGRSSTDKAILVRQEGQWKIIYMPVPYWGWDWYQPTVEPMKP